jgi:hypothetical protein
MNHPPTPAFLQPQWFFPFFVMMWLTISAVCSIFGGWWALAREFRRIQPTVGETFRFASGSLGAEVFPATAYGSCLFVTIADSGFELSILFPFRFLSPPLFIPWAAVSAVEGRRYLFFLNATVVRFNRRWPILTLRGRAGCRLKELWPRQRHI